MGTRPKVAEKSALCQSVRCVPTAKPLTRSTFSYIFYAHQPPDGRSTFLHEVTLYQTSRLKAMALAMDKQKQCQYPLLWMACRKKDNKADRVFDPFPNHVKQLDA